MLVRDKHGGFTLIELMIVLTIVAIMLFYAVPSFSQMMIRSRMRSAAEGLQNAIRGAQAAAIQRNRQVVFALTNTTPALNATAATNGGNWFSQSLTLVAGETSTVDRFLRGDSSSLSSGVSITGPAAICFNSLGRMVGTPAASTGVSAACTLPAAADKPTVYDAKIGIQTAIRVEVFLGGRVRLCDTAKTIAANPDGCTPT